VCISKAIKVFSIQIGNEIQGMKWFLSENAKTGSQLSPSWYGQDRRVHFCRPEFKVSANPGLVISWYLQDLMVINLSEALLEI